MKLFTTSDVLKITGLAPNTFDAWCKDSIVKPINGASGTGNHRVFSLTQVVGIAVAAELRESKRGCHPKYVADVVEAFSKLTEEKLINLLQGERFYFSGQHLFGCPILISKEQIGMLVGKEHLRLLGNRILGFPDVQRHYQAIRRSPSHASVSVKARRLG